MCVFFEEIALEPAPFFLVCWLDAFGSWVKQEF